MEYMHLNIIQNIQKLSYKCMKHSKLSYSESQININFNEQWIHFIEQRIKISFLVSLIL